MTQGEGSKGRRGVVERKEVGKGEGESENPNFKGNTRTRYYVIILLQVFTFSSCLLDRIQRSQ